MTTELCCLPAWQCQVLDLVNLVVKLVFITQVVRLNDDVGGVLAVVGGVFHLNIIHHVLDEEDAKKEDSREG